MERPWELAFWRKPRALVCTPLRIHHPEKQPPAGSHVTQPPAAPAFCPAIALTLCGGGGGGELVWGSPGGHPAHPFSRCSLRPALRLGWRKARAASGRSLACRDALLELLLGESGNCCLNTRRFLIKRQGQARCGCAARVSVVSWWVSGPACMRMALRMAGNWDCLTRDRLARACSRDAWLP